MNIIGHLTIGIGGAILTGNPLFLIGSILPDIALIVNEINLIKNKKRFDKWNVKYKRLYDISHSFYVLLPIYVISPMLFISYLIHLLVDIPFHTSNFRFNPFLVKRKLGKRAILLSGGMDSIAALNVEWNNDCDLIYFNYGQEYHKLEWEHAKKAAKLLDKKIIVIKKDWKHDIENRNYYMISEIKRMGYDEVITGNRNLLPLFDKYGDSNWFNLKIYQHLLKIYINMPLVGLFKWQIKNKIKQPFTYFSSENWNKNKINKYDNK